MDSLTVERKFMVSPFRTEREKILRIKSWCIKRFIQLVETLDELLEYDKCCRLADRYLLAMVFTYFLRANLEYQDYVKDNFFAALLLAYNMEEDDHEILITELEMWEDLDLTKIKSIRDLMFKKMDFRAAVSRTCCQIVMRAAQPEHKIWKRRRHPNHSGALGIDERSDVCPECENDVDLSYPLDI